MKLATALVLLALSPVAAVAAEPYTIDGAHSHMQVDVKHFGVSHMTCSFRDIAGEIQYDAADPLKSTVKIVVQAGSVFSEVKPREDAVKSAAFLDAEKFPEITFESTSLAKSEDGSLTATGNLTIHGVTKEVTFPITVNGPLDGPFGTVMGIEGALTVNRQDYGITFDRKGKSGVPLVGNDVMIRFSVEAGPKKEGEGN